MTIQQLLQNPEYSQKFVLEKLIQELFWRTRAEIWLHLDDEIDTGRLAKLQVDYNAYTIDKKPLEYILGHVDFFGVPFQVNEHTIIPRPETEYMITAVSDYLTQQASTSPYILVDIWTGSWVLGISILLQNSEAFQDVFLADISPDALQVAKQNYDTLISSTQYDTRFIQSNLASFLESYEVFQQAPIILVANLPYIPDETFDTNALENVQKREPRLAFVGGDDGLDLYREMFVQIRQAVSGCSFVMFLEMMTWQVEILKAEFGEWLEFEEVKTFHFNIRIVKTSFRV